MHISHVFNRSEDVIHREFKFEFICQKNMQWCAMPTMPKEIADLINSYLPDYELLPWIDEARLNFSELSWNERAHDFLKCNVDHITWSVISDYPWAIDILVENLDKVNWHYLSMNPAAIHILEKKIRIKLIGDIYRIINQQFIF